MKGVNISGAFNRLDSPLQQLPEKPVKLSANFFRKILRRIETIVPTTQDDNSIIKVTKPKNGNSPGLIINAESIVMIVCIDGKTRKVELLGRFLDE